MSDPLDEIQKAVRTYQRQLNSPVGYCRRAAHEIAGILGNRGIPEDAIDVVQGHFRGDEGLAHHFFVVVSIDGSEYIIDRSYFR